jgi:small-conductance mechanosensitive channel
VVPADTDVRQADAILSGIAGRDQRVMSKPAPWVSVSEVTQDTLKLTLSAWTSNDDYGGVSQNLAKAVKTALDQLRGGKAAAGQRADVEPQEKRPLQRAR